MPGHADWQRSVGGNVAIVADQIFVDVVADHIPGIPIIHIAVQCVVLDGKWRPLGELIGIDDRKGPQGAVTGKRLGVSHSLGVIRRTSAGHRELKSPADLHAAINKAPAVQAREAA